MDEGGRGRDEREALAPDASSVEYAWALQKAWSETADGLKLVPKRARSAALGLLVVGAIGGAIGASAASGDATQIWAVAAALALAAAGMLDTFVASPDRDRDWAAARMASERYKAEVWRFLTHVTPYDGSDDEREHNLRDAIDEIEQVVTPTVVRRVEPYSVPLPNRPGASVSELYLEERVDGQITYHRKAEKREKRAGDRLRLAVLVLSAGGALIVSLSSIPAIFDDAPLAAWVAAVAAATGAVTTYAGAGRHHDLARSSAKTLSWLDKTKRRFNQEVDPDAAFPAFVVSVERMIAIQNDTWADTVEG